MKATVVGLGREGTALARYLVKQGHDVTVTDAKPAEALQPELEQLKGLPISFALGGHPSEVLDGADVIYLSAGIKPHQPPFPGRTNLSSLTELFFERCPAPIVGITGSAGKTTTTTLVGKMLEQGPRRVWVGGNIGRPLINELDEMTPEDWVVLELSSFQLNRLRKSPHVSVVTNITPNHLDWHNESMQEYIDAKANIVEHQSAGDVAILNANDHESNALVSRTAARVLRFNGKDAYLKGDRLAVRGHDSEYEICRAGELQIPGRHNVDNVLAASLTAFVMGISPQAIRDVAIHFQGVQHRLQLVRELDGVAYYNDSIATAPERTLAALAVFDRPIVLIAGGRDKHLPLEPLADEATRKVKSVVLLGEAAGLLEEAFAAGRERNNSRTPTLMRAADLEHAVCAARKAAAPGDVVLLSPACTSYDMFKDFEERGREFVRLVQGL
ncbi:MAG TPA: UDP-N-acetylmuramoyl-L-alanine--D-glutamate ligase [Chloroflexota bacterium]|nr:UDP-N-acetylmuramoyl-L-alanine--D-glutamate ligase [Chloroflexota bacterium]